MTKHFIYSIILLAGILLFGRCDKKEIISQQALKGTIKGTVYPDDESGYRVSDASNINVSLEGTSPLLEATTDKSGKFELHDVPTGTYNVIVSRDGYGTYQNQGLQVVGGDVPVYVGYTIFERSKTIISDLSISVMDANNYLITGMINHDFPESQLSYNPPAIKFFISSSENPSSTNYVYSFNFSFKGTSGSQFQTTLSRNLLVLNQSSTIYMIAYGYCDNDYGYYDISSNSRIYTSLGQASNITSISVQ